MKYPWQLYHWHFEVSGKCTLKCPRCPRTELKLPWLNQELSLKDFARIFTPGVLSQIKYLLFCGHTGDPIYAKDFLEIVEYIKQNSQTTIKIVTNGSYKKEDWWIQLGQLLDHNDSITFSIDGLEDTNNIYRINSNWQKIMENAQAYINAGGRARWKFLVFQHNEHQIEQARELSKQLGFKDFIIEYTSRSWFSGNTWPVKIDGVFQVFEFWRNA